jgi:Catalytic LigB subunit of aromatic ring-opening dioxygenase
MADIVLGIGTSHSPLLNSPAEDYAKHAEIDASRRKLIDRLGRPVTYDELVRRADPAIRDQIRPEVQEERAARCTANIGRVAEAIRTAALDALIVIGDDQNEQFGDENMPAVLIYWGETIENTPLKMDDSAPSFWRRARAQYHEESESRRYPVASALARHLIDGLIERDFDVSQATRLAKPRGEGHAFGYVHRRLMNGGAVVPIVPIALNTYYPPNQMRPRRCYKLGQAIAETVRAYGGDARVGILASGGLSHFAVDEALDRRVLDACRLKDAQSLSTIPPEQLNSGTSEIRNWIAAAGALENLDTAWQDYVPCYRSPAGTGCGMGFAVWR